jgi:hypothetical protein
MSEEAQRRAEAAAGAARARHPLGRWRHLPTALAAATALLELSCLGGLVLPDTPGYLRHTYASGANVRFNVREPLYPLLLDLFCLLLPPGWRMGALVVLQQAAVAAIPWMVQRSCEWLGAPRAGFAAALLAALYLPLSLAAQVALTDALFSALFAATALLACRAVATGRCAAFAAAGAMAAAAMAQRSSGVALAAAGLVALAFTRPRAHVRAILAFAAAFAGVLGLVCLKNRLDYGAFNLVQGAGIHFYCRVAVVERALPDTPEAHRLRRLASEAGFASPLFPQAGWRLHTQLVEREKLSHEKADELLLQVAKQALLSNPWRTLKLTWRSMRRAVQPADGTHYALGGVLRPSDGARAERKVEEAWERSPTALATTHRLLPDYPPRAQDDDPRYGLLAAWGRHSRFWCGSWILHALLLLGLLGLYRRDAALVFLSGAAFAQLAATAFGEAPWVGHLDPAVPLLFSAFAIALCPRRTTSSEEAARDLPGTGQLRRAGSRGLGHRTSSGGA